MKKFLAMLVAAMMVLSLVAIPVLADGEVVFAVENAPATATPGDEITVNLTVNGTFEAHVLNMQFNYNADAFEYVSHTRGDVLNQIIDLGGTQLVDATTIPGSMRLGVMMPTAAFTQSGTICSVTLRVKEGAANGASDLALVITEFKNFPTGGQATPIANVVNNATVTITGGSEPTPVPPTEAPTPTQNPNTPAPGGMATISLTAGDVFSDGSGYQMLLDADATAFGNEIPAEGPLTQGGNAPAGLYDAFEYKIPVNADGSTTTSNVVVNDTVTIQVPAGTYDWCLTNPTPGDRIWIASSQGNVGGRADDYTFEAGYTYNFTVYLLGQNDATDVEIIPGGTPSTPVPPTQNPVTPEPGTTTGWGFETDPFAEGWTIRDDDGDGYNWEWMDASGSNYNVYEGTHCMASASYQNSAFGGGTALNPDNWLISPAFTAGSTVTFWYAGQDPNYAAEPFGVYVIANGTTSDELGHFTASNTYQQGSVDISAYAGQPVQVAFRHYGVTDMFRLNLDLVEVSGGGSTPNTPVPPTQNPNTPAPGGMATITLTAGDVFSDGSGYQMLLDADATAYGNEIPVEGPLTQSGNAPAGLYDAFEYKIPVNADGSTTTSNVVVNNSVTIQVPAGTYDWCLTNPTPGDRIWIASSQGNVGGRADDYTFEAGYTYNFTVYLLGQNDATDVEIIPGGGNTPVPPTAEPTPTQNPNTPAPGGMATISLTAGDVFSDGSGYQMLLDADATAFGNEIPAEGPLTMGGDAPAGLYDAFEYKIPVNADGSTTTSNVVVNNTVTIQVPAGTYDWCLTNPTPGDRIWIASSQGNVGGRADDYTFEAGYTYNFTVYLLGQNDATDVEIIPGGGVTPTPVPPTPAPGGNTGWGFETDPFAEGWTIRDEDGDGYNWEWMDASGSNYNVYEGTHCMASASFQNSAFGGGTALNPNNWLISPAFTAGSTVTFWYAGQDPNYAAETFGVYVIANGTTSDELAYFTASNTYQQGSVDISDFAGQTVQVAFRHYDVTDMFRLNLDLVEAEAGGEPPVPPTDAPITDAPITDAPITDAPITEAPITDAPITEAPITDEPVTPAPGDVIFSVGGVHYVAAGSQVSVDLTIDGEYEANGMNIWVQYDAEKLTLNSVDEGEIMKAIKDLGGMNILDFQSIPGSVRLGSMLPTDPVSGSGKIFTMNFTVAEGLEDGTEMPIEILVKEFFNMPVGGENTPIAFFAENGSIVVGSEPIVTDEPGVTDEPTAVPTDAPNPPVTGAMSLIGVGIAAIVASAGVVIFRKKEED